MNSKTRDRWMEAHSPLRCPTCPVTKRTAMEITDRGHVVRCVCCHCLQEFWLVFGSALELDDFDDYDVIAS